MGVFLLWLPEHLQSSDLLSVPAISPECLMAHSAFMIPMDPYHNARKYTRFLSFLEVTPSLTFIFSSLPLNNASIFLT